MKGPIKLRTFKFVSILLVVLTSISFASPFGGHAEKWTPLYSGKDLAGWHIEGDRGKLDKWHANGAILTADSGQMCYLATDEEFGDYDLKLEFKIPAGGNSGVGIRFPKGGWPSIDGMEVQILDDAAAKNAKEPENGKCGSIYMHIAPKASPSKPAGEWNAMRILCRGAHLNVWINKVEVLDVDLDKETTHVGKGKLPLAKRPRKGQIGLQAHYDSVEFRKIEVKRL